MTPALSPALACPVGLCSVQALRCLLQAAAPGPPHGTQCVAMPVGQRLEQHARLAFAQAHCQLPPLMGRQSPGAQCHSGRQQGWQAVARYSVPSLPAVRLGRQSSGAQCHSSWQLGWAGRAVCTEAPKALPPRCCRDGPAQCHVRDPECTRLRRDLTWKAALQACSCW